MQYIGDKESILRQVEAIRKINDAYIHSNGFLRISLQDGRTIVGRYYGLQCTANDRSRLHCNVSLGEEEADYPGVFDVMEVQFVEPIRN